MGVQVGRSATGLAIVVGCALVPTELAAQPVELHADGSLGIGVSTASQSTFQADPLAPAPADTIARVFTEVRPTLLLQSMYRRRIQWGLGYQFAGQLTADSGVLAYSNQAIATLALQPTPRTNLALDGAFAQGSQTQLVSLRAADAGTPTLNAPGNLSQLTASAGEGFTFELAPTVLLQQTARLSASAPQDALDQRSSDLLASVAIEKASRRTIGALEVRSRISQLRPIQTQLEPFASTSNAVLVRGSHDISSRWNTQGWLGIEQVYTDHDSKPLALLPTMSATLNFWTNKTNFAVEASRGAMPNLQIGTISIANRVVMRGLVMLDEAKQRAVRFSVGGIHNEPLGELDELAAGIFDVAQADLSVTTSLNRRLLLFGRYSASHQFMQDNMLPSMTMHVLLVGVSAQYSSTGKPRRPMPTAGRRVDNVDGVQPDGPSPESVKQ
ncbi:MAG: hypothetical protein SFX73_11200 [Kofleriaceae bacterium]|nr:hypothetical protein [Kofleriaceae bacterium]